MGYAVIGENETPEQLSARLHRPVCMLLRANRLYSEAWLLPGREIAVPEPDFCRKDAGICPAAALKIPAQRFEPCGSEWPIPARLRKWSAAHAGAALSEWCGRGAIRTIRPMETMAQFAERTGSSEAEVRRVNIYYGKPVPGVQLLAAN